MQTVVNLPAIQNNNKAFQPIRGKDRGSAPIPFEADEGAGPDSLCYVYGHNNSAFYGFQIQQYSGIYTL